MSVRRRRFDPAKVSRYDLERQQGVQVSVQTETRSKSTLQTTCRATAVDPTAPNVLTALCQQARQT